MIKNKDIYNASLGMIGTEVSAENIEDYAERAPYLIASFCSMAKSLDKKLRRRDGLVKQAPFSPVFLELEADFPLCERLITTAALYVAAMLVIEENTSLSDSLYDKYCDGIASLSTELGADTKAGVFPDLEDAYALCEPITDRYFFDD